MSYVDLGKTVEQHQQKKDMAEKNQKSSSKAGVFILLGILVALVGFGLLFGKKVAALFDPVSIVSNVATPKIKESDGRTNVLVMGIDRRSNGAETAVLTDTLLFASIGRLDGKVSMISLPRDLWVEANAGKGPHFMKINAVYSVDGVDELKRVVEEVLGMPAHYYVTVDFSLFKKAIDILGGIEINVEHAFIDYEYPVEGREADLCGRSAEDIKKMEDQPTSVVFPCRYERVEFKTGAQKMDGDTALKYARSRKGNNNEGTDFARAHRQQKVIMAVKDKALSLDTILDINKIKELYDTYSENVETNISFEDMKGFYLLSQRTDISSVRSIVLDDRSGADEGGLLYHPTDSSLYGGAYVLIPKATDYSQIRAYVQKYIFGE
uniref:LytR family transcriptional regulator n=1 Tax=candidate division WWE3 bacterium TaxID=2053526 RepID=A0A7C4TLB7_UNCKA